MHDDETKIGKLTLPLVAHRSANLRIQLTDAERYLLDKAAGGNTAAWVKRVILAAARRV